MKILNWILTTPILLVCFYSSIAGAQLNSKIADSDVFNNETVITSIGKDEFLINTTYLLGETESLIEATSRALTLGKFKLLEHIGGFGFEDTEVKNDRVISKRSHFLAASLTDFSDIKREIITTDNKVYIKISGLCTVIKPNQNDLINAVQNKKEQETQIKVLTTELSKIKSLFLDFSDAKDINPQRIDGIKTQYFNNLERLVNLSNGDLSFYLDEQSELQAAIVKAMDEYLESIVLYDANLLLSIKGDVGVFNVLPKWKSNVSPLLDAIGNHLAITTLNNNNGNKVLKLSAYKNDLPISRHSEFVLDLLSQYMIIAKVESSQFKSEYLIASACTKFAKLVCQKGAKNNINNYLILEENNSKEITNSLRILQGDSEIVEFPLTDHKNPPIIATSIKVSTQ